MALIRQAFELQGEEGVDEPQWSRAGVEHVIDQANSQEMQTALRDVVESATRNGLYPRPSKRSITFAPGANRSRALITLGIREDGRLDRWCAPEAFQTFYGLDASEVERLLGASEWATYEPEEVAALADRLDELMAEAQLPSKVERISPTKADAYRAFWGRFIERVKAEHPGWTNAKIPGTDNWLDMKGSTRGAHYSVSFANKGRLRSELYIDSGDGDENAALLAKLEGNRDAIEAAFGGTLTWEPLPGKRACRVAVYRDGDVLHIDQHDEYVDWFLDTSARLRTALEPSI